MLCVNTNKGISLTAGEWWDQDLSPGLLGLRAMTLPHVWRARASPLETQVLTRTGTQCFSSGQSPATPAGTGDSTSEPGVLL